MKSPFLLVAGALALAACSTAPTGGPSASATLQPRSGTKVSGTVTFTQDGDQVRVTGTIIGHTPGRKGFHIHDKGDCSAPDAMSAGGHFNPHKKQHGASPTAGHAGDLGNLTFDNRGRAVIDITVDGITVSRAANGIICRAVVIHVQEDDLKTDPTGNAGGRAACGVIQG